jgi:hypothetical protein
MTSNQTDPQEHGLAEQATAWEQGWTAGASPSDAARNPYNGHWRYRDEPHQLTARAAADWAEELLAQVDPWDDPAHCLQLAQTYTLLSIARSLDSLADSAKRSLPL